MSLLLLKRGLKDTHQLRRTPYSIIRIRVTAAEVSKAPGQLRVPLWACSPASLSY